MMRYVVVSVCPEEYSHIIARSILPSQGCRLSLLERKDTRHGAEAQNRRRCGDGDAARGALPGLIPSGVTPQEGKESSKNH